MNLLLIIYIQEKIPKNFGKKLMFFFINKKNDLLVNQVFIFLLCQLGHFFLKQLLIPVFQLEQLFFLQLRPRAKGANRE